MILYSVHFTHRGSLGVLEVIIIIVIVISIIIVIHNLSKYSILVQKQQDLSAETN